MTSMFEEERAPLQNPNAHLLMQPEASNYSRRSPLIEEESSVPASRAPGGMSGTTLASLIMSKQNLRAKPDTGWKLFSPSTWGFLRNTKWGQKKAAQRQLASMTSKVNSLGTAIKGISPRGGLFSNAHWGDTGQGTPYTAATAAADPNLATSASYGMSNRAADAWGVAADALHESTLHEKGSEPWKAAANRYQQAAADSGMNRQSFSALTGLGSKDSGQAVALDDEDHQAGDNVDGHTWLGKTGYDPQDEGDGIPSIVQEVLGPKAAGADGVQSLKKPAAHLSQESSDDDIDNDDEDAGGYQGYTQAQLKAYLKLHPNYR